MHDIDRGGNFTAARLAALAALRHAQSDGELAMSPGDDGAPQGGGRPRRGRAPRPPEDETPAPRLGRDMSSNVYAAVEAAVQKRPLEFVDRLVDYLAKLDCEAFRTAGAKVSDTPLDEAQFVAHRIAGVGRTLGFADLGDCARQAEAAITAYKLERTPDLRKTSIWRICKLAEMIEAICTEHGLRRD